MREKVFLNNAATTKIRKSTAKKIYKLQKYYFYKKSKLKKILINFIKKAAKIIKCNRKEIIWTSGATESNNLAIKGFLKKNDKLVIIDIDHKSITKTAKVKKIKVIKVKNNKGIIKIKKIKKIIKNNNITMLSICYVNNETGIINNIKKIGKICKKKNIIFHVDVTQALGKIKINIKKENINLMSASAHKIYGPQGVGFLYIKNTLKKKIKPQIVGGEQQNNIRAGTVSRYNIIGMCDAMIKSKKYMKKENKKINKLEKFLIKNLKNYLKNNFKYIKGNKIPHITSICIKNIDSNIIIKKLKDFVITNKSECQKNKKYSEKLKLIKIKKEKYKCFFRISIGKNNNFCEIEKLIESIINIYNNY